MARKPDQKILQSVNDLVAAVTQLVSRVAENAGRSARQTVADARKAAADSDVPEKSRRLRTAIRAHWASMSPSEREERVRRMLAGRGLKPKARKPGRPARGRDAAKTSRLRQAVKAHWASMSPQERAERVKRMLAGRGLKPKG